MVIICPSCFSQYAVDDTVLAGRARRVRCSHCGHHWLERRRPGLAATPSPSSAAPAPPILKVVRAASGEMISDTHGAGRRESGPTGSSPATLDPGPDALPDGVGDDKGAARTRSGPEGEEAPGKAGKAPAKGDAAPLGTGRDGSRTVPADDDGDEDQPLPAFEIGPPEDRPPSAAAASAAATTTRNGPSVAPGPRQRRLPPAAVAAFGAATAIALTIAAALLAEGPVTRVFPETAKLYARLPGRPTPADPGLLIRDVITHREGSGADQSIVIEGAVVNEAKTPVPLPALAIAVTAVMEGERATAAGDVIASEVVRFAEPTLAPGRVATFHARFDRVPPGPVQVRATFATPPETR